MTKKITVLMLVFVMVMAAGCGSQSATQETEKTEKAETTEENPFAKSELGENEKVDYNFSFGVENFDHDAMEIEYTGGELKIDFSVEVQGKEFTCGPMIFIDGINQPYALQAEGEKKSVQSVAVKKGKNTITTYIKPEVDSKAKRHKIYFLLMFEPDKKYEEGKSLGHAYNISQLLAWDFKTDKEAPQKYTGTISDVKSEKIDMSQYITDEDSSEDTQMQCCFSDKGTKLILKGGEKTKYRVCLFADGKLMKVNKNAEYVDVVANGEKGGVFEYDTQGLDSGNHILYAIAIPQNNLDIAMADRSDIKVVKGVN